MPDVSVRPDGNLSNDLSYPLYARAQYEAVFARRTATLPSRVMGGRLTQNWGRLALLRHFCQHRSDFDFIYRDLAFTSNDVMGSVARDFRFNNATFSPLLLLTYRFSDLAEARRGASTPVLGIEVKLDSNGRLSARHCSKPYWFTDGLNSGRRDQLYSADVGLKYNFASNVSLTTTVLYEARTSNVPLTAIQGRSHRPSSGFRIPGVSDRCARACRC